MYCITIPFGGPPLISCASHPRLPTPRTPHPRSAATNQREEQQAEQQQAALAKAKRAAHQQWQAVARRAEQEAHEWQAAAEEQAERADKAEQALSAAEATLEVASLWQRQQAVAGQQAVARRHAEDLVLLQAEHEVRLAAVQREHAESSERQRRQVEHLGARLEAALQQVAEAQRADKHRVQRRPGWLRRMVTSCTDRNGSAAVRDP